MSEEPSLRRLHSGNSLRRSFSLKSQLYQTSLATNLKHLSDIKYQMCILFLFRSPLFSPNHRSLLHRLRPVTVVHRRTRLSRQISRCERSSWATRSRRPRSSRQARAATRPTGEPGERFGLENLGREETKHVVCLLGGNMDENGEVGLLELERFGWFLFMMFCGGF